MRYHFNLHDADGIILDEEGSEFASLEAARIEARAAAKELAMEDMRNDKLSHAWQVVITDPNGRVLESVMTEIAMTISDALTANEFASLGEIGRGFVHGPIPSRDAELLLDRGLIYRMLGGLHISAAGRSRLALGN
jgi:hypothetical protein